MWKADYVLCGVRQSMCSVWFAVVEPILWDIVRSRNIGWPRVGVTTCFNFADWLGMVDTLRGDYIAEHLYAVVVRSTMLVD